MYIIIFFPVFQRMCILTSRQQMLTRRKRKQFKSSPSNVIQSIHVHVYTYMYIPVHVDKHIKLHVATEIIHLVAHVYLLKLCTYITCTCVQDTSSG